MLTKQETLLEEVTRAESSRVRESGELLCHMAHSLGFFVDGISFQVVFGHHLDSESFLAVHTLLS